MRTYPRIADKIPLRYKRELHCMACESLIRGGAVRCQVVIEKSERDGDEFVAFVCDVCRRLPDAELLAKLIAKLEGNP